MYHKGIAVEPQFVFFCSEISGRWQEMAVGNVISSSILTPCRYIPHRYI